MTDDFARERLPGWYWCRLRELNNWAICRWSGSNWYAADYPLGRPPKVIDSECLHEPIADDDPHLLAARDRAIATLSLADQLDRARDGLREALEALETPGRRSMVVARLRALLPPEE